MKYNDVLFRKNGNKQFIQKIMNTIIGLRYKKQPKLKEIKEKLLLRQMKYEEFVDQDLRNEDIEKLETIEKERWNRQIHHPLLNQKRIKDAKVVVFGCGGIGSNVLIGLIYSGVHYFKIIDFDKIKLSNLNRQTLFIPEDVNKHKINKAKERLLQINPEVSVETYNLELNYPLELNLLNLDEKGYPKDIIKVDKLIKWGDYIVNAVDYKGAPYMINDLCVKNQKPYYWGGVNHFLGEIYSFFPKEKTSCLRCIFGQTDFLNKTAFLRYRTKKDFFKGVNLGTTVIATGNFISELIIHDICGIKNLIHGHYFIFDSYNFEIIKIPLEIDNKCECQKFCSHKG
jgi:molybdopterin/thiamine biosynthesis adenylyltransferase